MTTYTKGLPDKVRIFI